MAPPLLGQCGTIWKEQSGGWWENSEHILPHGIHFHLCTWVGKWRDLPLTDVLSASTRIKVTPTALQETVPSGLCHVSNFLKFPLYLISSRNGLKNKNKNKTKRNHNSQLNFAASLSLLNYPRVASQAFPGHQLSDLNPNKPPSASLDFTGGRNTDSFSLIHAHGKAEVHGFFFFFFPQKRVSAHKTVLIC